jgi:hypothetical protein
MRPLLITPTTRQEMQDLVDFASRPENWYKVGTSNWFPGERPEFARNLDTFRVVFSMTEIPDEGLYRHVSVSIPPGTRHPLPNPVAVFTIAKMCGFTGGKEPSEGVITEPASDWMISTAREPDPCIIVAQKVNPT